MRRSAIAPFALLACVAAGGDAEAGGIVRAFELVPDLAGAAAVAVPLDGNHLYTVRTSSGIGTLTAYRRGIDGRIVQAFSRVEGVDPVDGLADVRRMHFAPDGALYFASPDVGALSVYQRNPIDGSLAGGLLAEGIGAVDAAIATTPETHYYVASDLGALHVLDAFGELVQTLSDGFGGVEGLGGAVAVAATPDGRFVYVSGAAAGAIAGFARASDGTLTPVAGSPFATPAGATALAISPDGRFLASLCGACNELRTFSIDAVTGALEVTGAAGSGPTTDVAFSRDGRRLILAGGDVLFVYDRDPASGGIEFLGGFDGAIEPAPGLAGACDVEPVGFFGDSLFVASEGDGSLASFDVAALRFVGRARDGEGPVAGLAQANSVLVSSDGNHVYAAGATDDAVTAFSRAKDLAGALTWQSEIRNGVAGAQGLDGAKAVATSPDGKHVFVVGADGDTVASYARNAVTGALTFESALGATSGVPGLDAPFSGDASPDGKHLYVGGLFDGDVWAFGYDATSGALFHLDTADDDGAGLFAVNGMAVSPDGAHVYAGGRSFAGLTQVGSIAVFARNAGTGALTRTALLQDEVGGVTGLDEAPNGLAVSPDGRSLYAASGSGGSSALTLFSRNPATGALTEIEALRDGAFPDCLDGASDVAVSPDGDFVYAAAFQEAAVCFFARDAETGALTQIGVRRQGIDEVDGLLGATALAVAADGRSVYAAASTEGTLAQFLSPVATAPEPNAALGCGVALATLAAVRERARYERG